MIVILIHRPPSNSEQENDRLCELLLNFSSGNEVLILGDYNLLSLKWASMMPMGYIPRLEKTFFDLFVSLGLTQHAHEATCISFGIILDPRKTWWGEVKMCPPFPRCLHTPIICE